ncbi:class I adenylate-forming enzyme family protein, partial [Alloalcanivorax venustensis]|uniref:class I adenylate-forming enzyme family protein n=1 Tax=Alloalcanivorax venustensis TaxID=172371 RepID=UPI003C4FCE3B
MKINFSTISERLADAFSEREALVNIERGRRYTFREFHLLTNRIVNMMRHKLDLQRGDNAVIILDNDNASLLHFFTAAKAGTPLCYTNYRDSLDDHTYQVDTVSAKVVFIEADLLESHYDMLRERQVTIVAMDKPEKEYQGVHYFWNLLEQVDDSNPNVVIDDRDDVVFMRFTGGTTGRGKCAMYTADTYLACRDSYWALPDPAWNPETRFIHLAPITHGSGMMFAPTQFKGGCTVTMNVPDLDAWCDNIAAERITNGFAVPTLLYRLLDMDEKGRARFKTIENMYYGAAPMSPSKLAELQAAFGNNFIQVYGSTEHFGVALSMSKADHLVEDGDDSHLASAGRPAPFTELEIMDDDGNPVPRGETG